MTTDQAVLQLFPEFRGDDFVPVLVGVGFSLADGSELEPFELELRAEFLGGYCLDVDWDGTRLVCSESYGGPFAVDIETGEVEPFPGLDEGAVSSVRR